MLGLAYTTINTVGLCMVLMYIFDSGSQLRILPLLVSISLVAMAFISVLDPQGSKILAAFVLAIAYLYFDEWKNGGGRRKRIKKALGEKGKAAIHLLVKQLKPVPRPLPSRR